jgi:6-phosphogluconolactonase (cycloisomerase 2 family)
MKMFGSAAVAALLLFPLAARAELAVSGNDGKQMRPGDTITAPEPDSISVLDITAKGVKRLGSVAAPAAMIGPPAAVAVSKDSRFALVTACQRLENGKLVPNDTVSVVDLSVPSNPRVVQTVHAGAGAMGVSISPNGKLALVAGSDSSTITAFAISGHTLTRTDQLQLPEKTDSTDVIFSRDGKTAIVVSRAGSKLILLNVKGDKISDSGKAYKPGLQPYGAVATHDGKYVINTNLGGALPAPGEAMPRRGRGAPRRPGTISMVNLATGDIATSVEVGPTPEHVAMSADGKYVAVVVANGTASVKSDPKWNSVLGLLKIYRVGDGTLTKVAQADSGHWCQGATISKDNKIVLLQCAGEREIEVFHFDGSSLTQDKAAAIPMGARPGSIATASSR